jgi:putative transposase
MLLEPREAKELFLIVIGRARRKFRFSIENFCVMGNHYHFIIMPGRGESLSAIMRWILGVFAQTYNRRTGTGGLFWNGRFFSRVLSSLREFLLAFDYVDGNPLRAGLVAEAAAWPFGGLAHHRGGNRGVVDGPPAWLCLLFPGHGQRALPWAGRQARAAT